MLLAIAAGACWSYQEGGLLAVVLNSDLESAQKITALRVAFANWGMLGPAVYVALVTAEVVIAPIPGLLLYAPGGLIFGWLAGGTYSLIGNVLGAGIACGITRTIGDGVLRRWFDSTAIERVQERLQRRGGLIIFALRLNPLTSSDLISYAAGLTTIPVWKVMLATGLGMAPLCYIQSSISEQIFVTYPHLLLPLIAIAALYAVALIAWIARAAGRNKVG